MAHCSQGFRSRGGRLEDLLYVIKRWRKFPFTAWDGNITRGAQHLVGCVQGVLVFDYFSAHLHRSFPKSSHFLLFTGLPLLDWLWGSLVISKE